VEVYVFYLFSTPILQFTKSVGGSVVSTTDYTGYSLLTKENGMSIGALVAIILSLNPGPSLL